MTRRIVGPFNRVEGDLEVNLDIEDGVVRTAWVNSPLYRGFEQILQGKDPADALAYTPRICGICSVSQSMAAAEALADAQGIEPPPNGAIARNLILAAENIADHLTHFYLFFMPDFARDIYRDKEWFGDIRARFKAVEGSAARDMLPARAQFLHIMGLLAGKWPHTLGLQPGGTTRAIGKAEQVRLISILSAFRRFLQDVTFGASLEEICELASANALEAWRDAQSSANGDFKRFLDLAQSLQLDRMGRAYDRFMSFGAYRFGNGRVFRQGVHFEGGIAPLDAASISEDVSSSWYVRRDGPRHPTRGVTIPDADAENAYSWCKAPRLDGQAVEVGALARQLIDGHPLIADLITRSGGTVANRVIARLLEVARLILEMEKWTRMLEPGEPFCLHGEMPDDADGVGLVEAARGSLGHWLQIRNGRIRNYQIIAPTTWNFSPRDGEGVPGALETALVGAPVRDGEVDPVAVQHVVRSFDPCMVCTVH